MSLYNANQSNKININETNPSLKNFPNKGFSSIDSKDKENEIPNLNINMLLASNQYNSELNNNDFQNINIDRNINMNPSNERNKEILDDYFDSKSEISGLSSSINPNQTKIQQNIVKTKSKSSNPNSVSRLFSNNSIEIEKKMYTNICNYNTNANIAGSKLSNVEVSKNSAGVPVQNKDSKILDDYFGEDNNSYISDISGVNVLNNNYLPERNAIGKKIVQKNSLKTLDSKSKLSSDNNINKNVNSIKGEKNKEFLDEIFDKSYSDASSIMPQTFKRKGSLINIGNNTPKNDININLSPIKDDINFTSNPQNINVNSLVINNQNNNVSPNKNLDELFDSSSLSDTFSARKASKLGSSNALDININNLFKQSKKNIGDYISNEKIILENEEIPNISFRDKENQKEINIYATINEYNINNIISANHNNNINIINRELPSFDESGRKSSCKLSSSIISDKNIISAPRIDLTKNISNPNNIGNLKQPDNNMIDISGEKEEDNKEIELDKDTNNSKNIKKISNLKINDIIKNNNEPIQKENYDIKSINSSNSSKSSNSKNSSISRNSKISKQTPINIPNNKRKALTNIKGNNTINLNQIGIGHSSSNKTLKQSASNVTIEPAKKFNTMDRNQIIYSPVKKSSKKSSKYKFINDLIIDKDNLEPNVKQTKNPSNNLDIQNNPNPEERCNTIKTVSDAKLIDVESDNKNIISNNNNLLISGESNAFKLRNTQNKRFNTISNNEPVEESNLDNSMISISINEENIGCIKIRESNYHSNKLNNNNKISSTNTFKKNNNTNVNKMIFNSLGTNDSKIKDIKKNNITNKKVTFTSEEGPNDISKSKKSIIPHNNKNSIGKKNSKNSKTNTSPFSIKSDSIVEKNCQSTNVCKDESKVDEINDKNSLINNNINTKQLKENLPDIKEFDLNKNQINNDSSSINNKNSIGNNLINNVSCVNSSININIKEEEDNNKNDKEQILNVSKEVSNCLVKNETFCILEDKSSVNSKASNDDKKLSIKSSLSSISNTKKIPIDKTNKDSKKKLNNKKPNKNKNQLSIDTSVKANNLIGGKEIENKSIDKNSVSSIHNKSESIMINTNELNVSKDSKDAKGILNDKVSISDNNDKISIKSKKSKFEGSVNSIKIKNNNICKKNKIEVIDPKSFSELGYSDFLNLNLTEIINQNKNVINPNIVNSASKLLSNLLNDLSLLTNMKDKDIPKYISKLLPLYLSNHNSYIEILFQFVDYNEKSHLYTSIMSFLPKNSNNSDKSAKYYYLINPFQSSFSAFKSLYNFKLQNINIPFSYFRYITNANGESFYRSFMFSLLENYFLSKNKDNLYFIFYDIFRISKFKENFLYDNIDLHTINVYFCIIYELIEQNKWENAYLFFIMAYNIDYDLDKILLNYLRFCLFSYFSHLQINKKFDLKYKNSYEMMALQFNEPNKLIIEALPYMFNVKIEISVIEKEDEDFTVLYFHTNEERKNKEDIVIKLGYFYSGYHVIYDKEMPINCDVNIDKDYFTECYYKLYEDDTKEKCKKCNGEKFIINTEQNYLLCYDCLYKTIESTINERANELVENKGIGRECKYHNKLIFILT